MASLNDRLYEKWVRIWSKVVTLFYHIKYWKEIGAAKAAMEVSRQNLFLVADEYRPFTPHPENVAVSQFLRKFKYTSDAPFVDWWINEGDELVYWLRGQRDDCDGAAAMAKWAWKQFGVESDIRILRGESNMDARHAICVRRDMAVFTTNGFLVNVERFAEMYGLKNAIIGYFGAEFTQITDEKGEQVV